MCFFMLYILLNIEINSQILFFQRIYFSFKINYENWSMTLKFAQKNSNFQKYIVFVQLLIVNVIKDCAIVSLVIL
jgi:hypothetical protein